MTDTEIRQLQNDRDYWKRVAQAYERKYGPVAKRSAIVMCRSRFLKDGRRKGCIETFFCADPSETVTDTNWLKGVYDDLCADLQLREEQFAREETTVRDCVC